MRPIYLNAILCVISLTLLDLLLSNLAQSLTRHGGCMCMKTGISVMLDISKCEVEKEYQRYRFLPGVGVFHRSLCDQRALVSSADLSVSWAFVRVRRPSSVRPSSVRPSTIHIFDFFSKTVSQIHFKLGGDVPWVGLYQVCSNGHGPVIFGFFMNFFVHFWGKS